MIEYPTDRLFSRQDMHRVTGIADDVLGYWMRNDLLISVHAEGRTHRRFRYDQLHIAVVLNGFRALGANISVLRAFATKLQTGCRLAANSQLPQHLWHPAAQLSGQIAAFNSGCHNIAMTQSRPLETVEEVIADWADHWYGSSPELAVDFAVALSASAFDTDALLLYQQITNPEHLRLPEEVGWLAWMEEGEAKALSADGGNFTSRGMPVTALWICISTLVRDLWAGE